MKKLILALMVFAVALSAQTNPPPVIVQISGMNTQSAVQMKAAGVPGDYTPYLLVWIYDGAVASPAYRLTVNYTTQSHKAAQVTKVVKATGGCSADGSACTMKMPAGTITTVFIPVDFFSVESTKVDSLDTVASVTTP